MTPEDQAPQPKLTEVSLTIRLPQAMRDRLARLAATKALKDSSYARMLLQEGMDREEAEDTT